VVERKIAEAKLAGQEVLIRPEVETKRIAAAVRWARQNGLSRHCAAAFEHLVINESCHVQLIYKESQNRAESPETDGEEYEVQKRNLRSLTEHWAGSYDRNYDKGHFGTREYKRFELQLLGREISNLPHREVLVDLGCATGKVALAFCDRFTSTIGYDISAHMIERARMKAEDKAIFRRVDIEKGLDLSDNTASLVVMNLGTASDVRDIEGVIKEILRVLKPGGKFFLSFYNREAPIYRWEFIPWSAGLTATFNIYHHCLEVYDPKDKQKKMPIYAKLHTVDEVRALVSVAHNVETITYPAMSMILPGVLFKGQRDAQKTIASIDRSLINSNLGAYIIATGEKK